MDDASPPGLSSHEQEPQFLKDLLVLLTSVRGCWLCGGHRISHQDEVRKFSV